MRPQWDAIVVGAGPAGLACAAAASDLGLKVLVLDEQPAPGGQIYRNIENQPPQRLELLGPDYRQGLSLVNRFHNCGAEYLPQATAWKIEADGRVCYSSQGKSREILAKRIVIATGAMERPVPFPGWTLPGVMGVGAVDALYKNSGLAPEGPVTMVGNGPLMLAVAVHLNQLGVEVSHFLDTRPAWSTVEALRYLPDALAKPGYLLKGAAMLMKTRRIVRHHQHGISGYAAAGEGRLEKLTVQCGLRTKEIRTTTLLVHEGVIPRTEFARQLRLEHVWEPVQRYWHPRTDTFGRSSEPNIYVAGDGGRVQGAAPAEQKGVLAAIDIAADLKGLPLHEKHRLAKPILRELNMENKLRSFIDAAYRPRPGLYSVADETIVCRCEEVTAGDIRRAISLGMKTPDRVKSITRCGMGPCQGRMCGHALSEIIALETGRMTEDVTPLNIRPPVRMITVGELTRMERVTNIKGN